MDLKDCQWKTEILRQWDSRTDQRTDLFVFLYTQIHSYMYTRDSWQIVEKVERAQPLNPDAAAAATPSITCWPIGMLQNVANNLWSRRCHLISKRSFCHIRTHKRRLSFPYLLTFKHIIKNIQVISNYLHFFIFIKYYLVKISEKWLLLTKQ